MTKDIELLPCPWGCSGEIGHRIGRDTLRYVCMTCGAEGPFVEANAETPEAWERALAAWNRRSTDMESERPAPAAVAISDRMVQIAWTEFNDKRHTFHTEAMRAALEAALSLSSKEA